MKEIDRLRAELDIREEEIRAMIKGLDTLQTYLQSEKFWQDPTVQVQDVLCVIQSIREARADVEVCTPIGAHSDLKVRNGRLVPADNVEWRTPDPQRPYHYLGVSRD